MENFLPGWKTKIAGLLFLAYGCAKLYIEFLNKQDITDAIGFIGTGLGLIGIRVAMTTETDRKIEAFANQLEEVTRIILDHRNLPVDDTTKIIEQKPAPVVPQTIEVKMSDGTTKTISVSDLSQDFLKNIKLGQTA